MDQREIDRIAAEVGAALAVTDRQPEAPAPDDETPPVSLVTENVVRAAHAAGRSSIRIVPRALVTPLAKDALSELGLSLASALPDAATGSPAKVARAREVDRVAIGAVPGARKLEATVARALRDHRLVPVRVPTPIRESAHLARQVAGAVCTGQAAWGVVIDEAGVGAAAVANRVAGIVAVSCGDVLTARWARERFGADMLCVSSELVAPGLLREMLNVWIQANVHRPPEFGSIINDLDRRSEKQA